MVFIKTTMLVTIMFLFCTFNVHATSEVDKSIVPSGRLLDLEGSDIDPKFIKCFKPVQDNLIEFQKRFQEEMKKNPEAKPTQENTEELFGIIEEALKCMKENATTKEQARSIEQLLNVKADLKKLMKDLDECVKAAGEGAKDDCAEQGEFVNEKMLEFVERAMTFWLEFIPNKDKPFSIRLAAFGIRVHRESKHVIKFVQEVANFVLDVVRHDAEVFAKMIKAGVKCVWDSVKAMHSCIKNYWRGEKENKDEDEFKDFEIYTFAEDDQSSKDDQKTDDLDEYKDFEVLYTYIPEELTYKYKKLDVKINQEEGTVSYYDEEGTRVKKEGDSNLAMKMLEKEIIKDIHNLVKAKEGEPTIEDIKRAMDEVETKLIEKFGEQDVKWLMTYTLLNNYSSKPMADASAHDAIKDIKEDILKELNKQIFYLSGRYTKTVKQINEQAVKAMEVNTDDFSKEEKEAFDSLKNMMRENDNDMEQVVANMMEKFQEMHQGL